MHLLLQCDIGDELWLRVQMQRVQYEIDAWSSSMCLTRFAPSIFIHIYGRLRQDPQCVRQRSRIGLKQKLTDGIGSRVSYDCLTLEVGSL